ncbi:MAG TPA: MetQ/NlpA family ABC transporter substrate-binding protein [Virgibacillus sp.]|nr:MetQ/NlpA family ABC transporter substrate-binding protein [Virgibacillus sp.]
MKKSILFIAFSLILLLATACGGDDDGDALDEKNLKVGVTPGPHEEILEKVKEVAEDDGLDIEIDVISDYSTLNIALSEGDLDLNSYQHRPFMDEMNEDRGLGLVEVAQTVNFPMGIYSDDISDIDELEKGDKIGLPNDPTNSARALILFEEAGLITLDEDADVTATVKDIEENELDLDFVELEAAQIPRQLGELKAAAINTNYAIEAGYIPTEDALQLEPNDSPWVNIISVREENEDDEAVEKFIDAYQTDEVKDFIEENYKDSLIVTW